MATPNGMVAWRKTMTRDTRSLNNTPAWLDWLLRAWVLGWQQTVARVLGLASGVWAVVEEPSAPQGEQAAESSGGQVHRPGEERDERTAGEEVAVPVFGAWFERSNLLLELEQHGESRRLAAELDAIGKEIKRWRSSHKQSRAQLAARTGMTADALLFLETGSGIPEDLTRQQLARLRPLLAAGDLNAHAQFEQLAGRYLAALAAEAGATAPPGSARTNSDEPPRHRRSGEDDRL
jgi:transcriptional regulator with XRE-family HTH domain